MRIGVYNRHWATLGGGEKYGGGIAQALQDKYDVELVSHEPFDVESFSERLTVDLSASRLRVIDNEPRSVTTASADYDLFVNTSYLSNDPSAADAGIYVVHFPSPLVPPTPPLYRLLHPQRRQAIASSAVVCGTGFYPASSGALHTMMWTNGEGELLVDGSPDEPLTLLLSFSRSRPAVLGPAEVTIEVDDVAQQSFTLEPATSRMGRPSTVAVPIPPGSREPTRVLIRSATFVPEELLGTDDSRRLGVPLTLITTKPRHRGPHQRPRSFVDSYTKIVANAAFTQGFIDRWWNVESTVVYPPVSMREAGTKKNTILSVGRFFAAEHGHSKKQLEMVRAFRRLCDRGLKGWELHLVGGCASDGQAYLQAVQSAAAGLPVVMHPNASGAELHELYASASIFWSFTGLGEHPRRDPARFEHFGITTVEAMSAGAVPIVLRAGGQVEIVRPEIEGLLFDDIGSVVKATWRVASNDELRARLSIGARERAKHFDMTRFTERFQAVVEEAVAAER